MSWHVGTATDYDDMLDQLIAICEAEHVSEVAINAGGSGYVVGDNLLPSGGTYDDQAEFVVSGVSGGAVTQVRIVNAGAYSIAPGNPAATTTDGAGTGCTVDLTFTATSWDVEIDTAFDGDRVVMLHNTVEDVYVGIRAYYNTTYNSYGWQLVGFNGYQAGLDWDEQPGYMSGAVYVPMSNAVVTDFWISITNTRMCGAFKIGSVYPNFYLGLLDKFATDSEYSYPLAIIGCHTIPKQYNNSDIYYSGMGDPGADSSSAQGAGLLKRPDGSTQTIQNFYGTTSWADTKINIQPYGSTETLPGTMPAANKWYSTDISSYKTSWRQLVSRTPNVLPAMQLKPIGNDYTIVPFTVVESVDMRRIHGTLAGVFWLNPDVAITTEDLIVVGNVAYRVFQNCDKSSRNNLFAIKEA